MHVAHGTVSQVTPPTSPPDLQPAAPAWRGQWHERRAAAHREREKKRAQEAHERLVGQLGRRTIAALVGASPEATPDRAPEARPSLEELTLKDHKGSGWNCTLMEFECGAVEFRAYYTGPEDKRPRSARAAPFDDRPEADKPSAARGENGRHLASIARSRAACIRRCLALQADHMLTLTKRGKFETLDEAWEAYWAFNKSMRRKFGGRWKFVAVPELHATGGYHIHVALHGFWWVGLLRRLWMRALGGKGNESGDATPGNIDLKSFVRVSRGQWRVARYIAKYLGKGFSSLDSGRRAYSCSAGLHPARVTRWREPPYIGHTDAALAIQRRLTPVVGVDRWSAYFWSRDDGRTGFVMTGERGKNA